MRKKIQEELGKKIDKSQVKMGMKIDRPKSRKSMASKGTVSCVISPDIFRF